MSSTLPHDGASGITKKRTPLPTSVHKNKSNDLPSTRTLSSSTSLISGLQGSILKTLPNELLFEVISNLDPADKVILASTCRDLKQIIKIGRIDINLRRKLNVLYARDLPNMVGCHECATFHEIQSLDSIRRRFWDSPTSNDALVCVKEDSSRHLIHWDNNFKSAVFSMALKNHSLGNNSGSDDLIDLISAKAQVRNTGNIYPGTTIHFGLYSYIISPSGTLLQRSERVFLSSRTRTCVDRLYFLDTRICNHLGLVTSSYNKVQKFRIEYHGSRIPIWKASTDLTWNDVLADALEKGKWAGVVDKESRLPDSGIVRCPECATETRVHFRLLEDRGLALLHTRWVDFGTGPEFVAQDLAKPPTPTTKIMHELFVDCDVEKRRTEQKKARDRTKTIVKRDSEKLLEFRNHQLKDVLQRRAELRTRLFKYQDEIMEDERLFQEIEMRQAMRSDYSFLSL